MCSLHTCTAKNGCPECEQDQRQSSYKRKIAYGFMYLLFSVTLSILQADTIRLKVHWSVQQYVLSFIIGVFLPTNGSP